MSRLERSSDVATTIARLAAESFAGFELSYDDASRSWWCRNPHHGNHAFSVYFQPGVIVVWGDIGEYVFRHSDRDSIGWWLSQGVKDAKYCDYFLGKLRASDGAIKEFHVGDAYAYIDERVAELRAEWDREAMAITVDDEDPTAADDERKAVAEEHAKARKPWDELRAKFTEYLGEQLNSESTCWYLAWTESGFDDPPSCEGWASSALWVWHAARTFARLHATWKPTPKGALSDDDIDRVLEIATGFPVSKDAHMVEATTELRRRMRAALAVVP